VLLSLRVVLVWGLKQCFPLVGTLGHEWVPERTPVGAKRSGALGGFAESCAGGLSWHNRPGEGENLDQELGRNGAKRNDGRVIIDRIYRINRGWEGLEAATE